MQKIVVILIFCFSSIVLHGQFPESFEGGTFPPIDWLVFNNGIGTGYSWRADDDAFFGERAAFIRWEDVETGLAEDWLVSPLIEINASAPVLTFYQKQDYAREYFSEYTVRVSTISQNNPDNFTIVDTQVENDLELYYTLHDVDLSAYVGQNIYIAFVMTNDDGDNWTIDDIDFPHCNSPKDLIANNYTATGADLNWTDPMSSSWDVEIVLSGEQPTGIPTASNITSLPFTWTGGDHLTTYDFYVRSTCGDGTYSNLNGPESFTTSCGNESCDYLFVLSDTYGDDWNGAYIEIKQNGITTGYVTQQEDGYGPYVIPYSMCSEVDFELIWHSGNWDQECIFELYDGYDQLYYSFDAGEYPERDELFFSDLADCEPVTCRFPYDLISSDYRTNGATFSWVENDGATMWDLEIVSHGMHATGEPDIAGVTENPYQWTGGDPGTYYDVYVRSVCGADDFSKWTKPSVFSTRCDDMQTGFPFEENFDVVELLPSCWTSANNGEGRKSWTSKKDTYLEDTIVTCEHEFVEQNVWLLSPEFDFSSMVGSPVLTWDWKMSYYWMVYPYDKGNLNLLISLDGGENWSAPLWNEEVEDEFLSFEWMTTELMLDVYAGEQSVLFAFQYVGKDASTIYLDNFSIIEDDGNVTSVASFEKESLSVYPVPAREQLYISYVSPETRSVKMTITNIVNQTVQAEVLNTLSGKNEFEIDISDLPTGVYLVMLDTGKQVETTKVVVE